MFLRAGYNRRFTTVAVGLGIFGPVYLIRFQCGDLAWLDRRRGLSWHPARLRKLVDVGYSTGWPSSPWPRSESGKPVSSTFFSGQRRT